MEDVRRERARRPPGPSRPAATPTYQLLFALPASADNKVQGDSVTLTSAYTLAQ